MRFEQFSGGDQGSPEARLMLLQRQWESNASEESFTNYALELFRFKKRREAEQLLELFLTKQELYFQATISQSEAEALSMKTLQLLTHPEYYARSVTLSSIEQIESYLEQYPNVYVGVVVDEERLRSLEQLEEHIRKQVTGIRYKGNIYRLLSSTVVEQLKAVDLGHIRIGAAGAEALAQSEHISGWHTVDLSNNKIGAAGAEALAQSEHISGWHTVNLMQNNIGAVGERALIEAGRTARKGIYIARSRTS